MGAVLGHLYLITDQRVAGRDICDVVQAALAAVPDGAFLVQLRAKDLSPGAMLHLARRLRAITAAHDARLLINDRLDVALASGADGVHLPENGLDIASVRAITRPSFLIGVSRHGPGGAAAAARAGADLVVCGPIWPTPSKPGTEPLGVAALTEAAAAIAEVQDPDRPTHLFALGGVDTPERAAAARAAGAFGAASIRAFCAADEPGATAAAMHVAVTTAIPHAT